VPRIAPSAHRKFKTSGTLSPAEWAQIIVQEAHAMHIAITPRQVAEGVATTQIESGGDASNEVQGPSGHIGAWAEGTEGFPSSAAKRLDPRASTRAALANWSSNGKSWWQAWGQWEKEQSGRWGGETSEYKPYLGIAEAALKATGGKQTPAEAHPGSPAPAPASTSGGGSSIGGDFLRFGLVAVLVIGGTALIGLGTTRVLGTAQSARGG
jgi:hypothetical protein